MIKLYYEKAIDCVHLDFLEELLKRGFGPKWIAWIKAIVGGSIGVKINGCESEFFLTSKGLRQGDLISPRLFNLVVNVLARMLIKATASGLTGGLCLASALVE